MTVGGYWSTIMSGVVNQLKQTINIHMRSTIRIFFVLAILLLSGTMDSDQTRLPMYRESEQRIHEEQILVFTF